jgi:hypothetical protein
MGDDSRAALASFYGLALTPTTPPADGETLLGSIAAAGKTSSAPLPTTSDSSIGSVSQSLH